MFYKQILRMGGKLFLGNHLSSPTSNAIASLSYSFNSNQDLSLVVAGTEGTLLAYLSGKIVKWSATPPSLKQLFTTLPEWQFAIKQKLAKFFPKNQGQKIRNSPHYRQISQFFKQIETQEPFTVTSEKAREVVRLWEEIVSIYAK